MDGSQLLNRAEAELDEMGRGKKATGTKLSPAARVWLGRLKSVVADRTSFDALVSEIADSSELTTEQVIELADRFAIPGKRPGSRKAAIVAINKRFVELARFREKNERAAKTRPW